MQINCNLAHLNEKFKYQLFAGQGRIRSTVEEIDEVAAMLLDIGYVEEDTSEVLQWIDDVKLVETEVLDDQEEEIEVNLFRYSDHLFQNSDLNSDSDNPDDLII
ncbi:hypothetical protein FQA39_LY01203 [Lamprigera yunnana]|nr:hypothetical protein FQA39_LY01203 [Lamprigera yunnana]